jgi:hypothetical protein
LRASTDRQVEEIIERLVMPAPAGRMPEIEINEEIDFQRRAWRVQRMVWVAMALLLGAAMLGFFGLGPLSRIELTVAPGVSVEYHRWARAHAPLQLRFLVGETSAGPGRLHLSHSLLSRVRVVRIEPEPTETRADPEGITYQFRIDPPVPVVFHVEPERAGRVAGRVRAGDGAPVELPLLVWP